MIPEYSDPYVLDYDLLSSPLSTYFAEENMSILFDDLLHKCETLFNNLTVTENQAKNINANKKFHSIVIRIIVKGLSSSHEITGALTEHFKTINDTYTLFEILLASF